MDSEPIAQADTSFDPAIVSWVGAFQFKLLAFVFFIFLLLNTDVYYSLVLSTVPGAVSPNQQPTTKGTVLTGLALVGCAAVADVFVRHGLV